MSDVAWTPVPCMLCGADDPRPLVVDTVRAGGETYRFQVVRCRACGFDYVTPRGAGAVAATEFLARHLGLPMSHVIACGDSGNDLCMLQQSGCAVIVANAFSELAHLTGPSIFRSRHQYAAGVHDGVQHWLEHFEREHAPAAPPAECA